MTNTNIVDKMVKVSFPYLSISDYFSIRISGAAEYLAKFLRKLMKIPSFKK